ncbi:TPA: helix-turn-helix transcriptional regulator [Escherichia coli]|uniref:helix-turn-helix domain-containing protein n=1 Tax=Escherichia coli TaxID=562 RepID=UPI000BDEEDE1|nr:helix-turn-helix transcriptional regulator [Escherichia coli]HAI8369914.1 helix-turn-helix transcriptional regulator [Escherichia coli]
MLITRLKEARRRAGLTQEKLGILAGLDEASASTRINQYEKGKHSPNFEKVSNLAKVLNVPVSFLYTPEDDLAQFILLFDSLSESDRKKILDQYG